MSRPDPSELKGVIDLTAGAAADYLAGIADRPVRDPSADEVAETFGGPLPEEGVGAERAMEELFGGIDGAVHSAGPRSSSISWTAGRRRPPWAPTGGRARSIRTRGRGCRRRLAARLEQISIDWLKELFGLPAEWGGVLTTGATMANFVALGCARRWCSERAGVDVDELGVAAAPPIAVLGGGYIHPSDVKALGMLGVGQGEGSTASRVTTSAVSTSRRWRRRCATSTARRRS